jgi:hypothetical protein
MPFEDVGYRLVADFVSQITQGADQSPIAPPLVLAGQLHHQVLHFLA